MRDRVLAIELAANSLEERAKALRAEAQILEAALSQVVVDLSEIRAMVGLGWVSETAVDRAAIERASIRRAQS